ncbi:MAG: dephospho-CoA kinase [Thermoleophilia bacterium]|nr:dephospho-CoA kinase [Thermoleophilia bacterium]
MAPERNSDGPIRIALTGGIGSGKSTALLMFAARGAAVRDSDEIVHGLIDRADVRARIRHHLDIGQLPPGVDGRGLIASIVFADDVQLLRLEEIIFPLVNGEIDRWLAIDEVASAPLAVIELPMLFEAGMAERFDKVVLVTAPSELRKTRHEGRVGLADFERRAARQLPEDEKRARSDYVYDNTGSPEDLDHFIAGVIEKVIADKGE